MPCVQISEQGPPELVLLIKLAGWPAIFQGNFQGTGTAHDHPFENIICSTAVMLLSVECPTSHLAAPQRARSRVTLPAAFVISPPSSSHDACMPIIYESDCR